MKILPTGIPSLDFAIGRGGLPVGKIVELYGRESIGKTAVGYYMIAEAQRRGVKCAYVNVEGTWDPVWAKKISSIRLSELDMSYPDPGSEAVDDLAEAVTGGKYGLVVFDSVGSMLGDREQDPKNSRQAGGQSLLITHMVKLISRPASVNECTVVFINQVRDNFNMPGQEVSPGGHALKHQASLRILLRPGQSYQKTVKGQTIKVGFRVTARIEKNKIATPYSKTGWDFWTRPSPTGILGIDLEQDLLDTAINWDVIERPSNVTYAHPCFPGGKVKSRDTLLELVRQNDEVRNRLTEEVRTLANELEKQKLED